MKRRGPFTVRSSEIVYENPWIKVREDRVVRPGGGDGIFGVVEMVPGSSVLPITADGHVHLVREYKYAVEKPSVEVISGGLDEGESPLEAARRELAEELGLAAEDWTDLGVLEPFTTVVDSPNYMFLARELSVSTPSPDDGERIEGLKVPFDDALRMVIDGEITHAASCVIILKAARLLQ